MRPRKLRAAEIHIAGCLTVAGLQRYLSQRHERTLIQLRKEKELILKILSHRPELIPKNIRP